MMIIFKNKAYKFNNHCQNRKIHFLEFLVKIHIYFSHLIINE